MRLLLITFYISLFLGLSFIWIEVILKLIDEMIKVHVGFCIPIPIILILWYLFTGLIFKEVNRQIKIIRFSKNTQIKK